jgi:hypothetical protein
VGIKMKKVLLVLCVVVISLTGCIKKEITIDEPANRKKTIQTVAQTQEKPQLTYKQQIIKEVRQTISLGKDYYNNEDYDNATKCFMYAQKIAKENNLIGLANDANKWLDSIGDRQNEEVFYVQLEAQREEMEKRARNNKIQAQLNDVEVKQKSKTIYWNPVDGFNYSRGVAQLTYTETEISGTRQVTEQHGRITRDRTTVTEHNNKSHTFGVEETTTTINYNTEDVTNEVEGE